MTAKQQIWYRSLKTRIDQNNRKLHKGPHKYLLPCKLVDNVDMLFFLLSHELHFFFFFRRIDGMSEKLETSKGVEGRLIYTHFIQAYLTRKNLPGKRMRICVNSGGW